MKKQHNQTITAGGIIVNEFKEVVIVNQNHDSWSLPKGHVEKDETREKGFIGATIGRKTVTKRNVRKYSCSNCGESWILG